MCINTWYIDNTICNCLHQLQADIYHISQSLHIAYMYHMYGVFSDPVNVKGRGQFGNITNP